jgi:hypothetical protein
MSNALWVANATSVLPAYAKSYDNKLDKGRLIAEQKQEMLNQLHDPQFVEFYDFVNAMAIPRIRVILDGLAGKNDIYSKTVLSHRDLIVKLIEINLAHGFANLARQVRQNQAQIPNFDQQPTLVSVISLLCQRAGTHIDAQHLASIESKYRKHHADLPNQIATLFPDIKNQPQMDESVRKYIQEYIKTTDKGRKDVIKHALFPHLDTLTGQKAKDVDAFIATLDALHQKDRELNQLFSQVADAILLYFFPKKFSDMEAPAVLQVGFIQNSLYDNVLKALVADILQESYEPLENNITRKEGWENDLQECIGAPDLNPVIQAPSALLVAFTRNYIHADPRVMNLTAWALNTLMHPQAAGAAGNDSQQQEELLNQLSEEQLANWMVESVQTMLQTQDPHLLGLGQFAKQALNNLTLALMAKGAKLVIPEDELVDSEEFLKEFSDRLVAKFSSLQGDQNISAQFWEEFVKDLPVPPVVKSLLVPLLNEKSASLQAQLTTSAPDLQAIQQLFSEAEAKIRSYENGEQLLSITEKVSDEIVEQILEKNVGLVETLGLGETIEELFAQYLPGITINDELKNWFKANISSLGATEEGDSPQSIVLLKRGIQAVLRKAMVNTIEKNFKNNSKDYAAQLLNNFHQAFSNAFANFDATQRKALETALSIQAKIEDKNGRIKALKEKVAKKPEGITDDQTSLLQNVIAANNRVIRASNYVDSLIDKRDAILDELNGDYEEAEWTVEMLPYVSEALILRKMEASAYPSVEAYMAAVKRDVKALQKIQTEGSKLTETQENQLARKELLLALLDLSSDELKLLSDAINTDVTINHAENELTLLRSELKAKENEVKDHHPGKKNIKEWRKGKEWMKLVIRSKQEINQLTQDVASLDKSLDTHLGTFQVLSEELTDLLGLGQDVKLDLPQFLQDQVWPAIQSAKKQQIARLLFAQVSPLLVSIADIQQNKDKLKQLSQGNSFLGDMTRTVSQEVVGRIPEFVTSYKPCVTQILAIIGIENPTDEEISRMENALYHALIGLGKEGTTASMLKPLTVGFVPKDKEEALSQSIATLIEQSAEDELSKDDLLALLKKEVPPANKKDEQKLEKQAHALAKSVNQFLFSHGKGRLTALDLLDAYQAQIEGEQPAVEEENVEGIIHDLESEEIVENIKKIVITPEEIAQALNDVIPGATDLHTLIAPQLQDAITGGNATFKASHEVLRQLIEGTLLRLFVKIAEANQGQDVMVVMTQKLRDLAINAQPVKGKTAEEVARQMIDRVLADVLGIGSEQDLDAIPLVFRKIAFKKIQEQAYQHLTPMLLPIIERNQNRAELKEKSGSHFLGNLCEALSKDVFALLPLGVNSYKVMAKEALMLLSDAKQPNQGQIDAFANEIALLVKQKSVKNHLLVQAYAKVSKQNLTSLDQDDLIAKLKEGKIKEAIKNIVITPEEMAASIGALMPHLDSQLQKALANEIQTFIHDNPDAYQNGTEFIRVFVEGLLLRVFLGVAEKNPKETGKDTLIVMTEKLLDLAKTKYEELKGDKSIEEITQELNDSIMQDILGIDSPDAFEGLPTPMKAKAYDAVKNQLGGLLLRVQRSLMSVDSGNKEVQEAKELAKQFGIAKNATKSNLEILAEDIANMVVVSVPHVLTEIAGENIKGVTSISKSIESYLEELSRGEMEIAKVLLAYTRGAQFQQMLGENLTPLANQDGFVDDKQKAAELLGNLIMAPLSQLIERTVQFEAEHQKEFNQKLMANLLHVGAGHFRNLNKAKKLAAKAGQSAIRHQDFVEAADVKLHPGVPIAPVTYQRSIDFIAERLYDKLTAQEQEASGKVYGKLDAEQAKVWAQEQENVRKLIATLVNDEGQGIQVLQLDSFIEKFDEIQLKVTGKPLTHAQKRALKQPDEEGFTLRDVIREEAEAPKVQRQDAFYGPQTQVIMKMLFPNGKDDLTFVPEELRGAVWKAFKKNLLPIVLPMITEIVLDPATINKIVLSSLESARDSLSGEITLDSTPEPADLPLDDLDQASGELILEALKMATLPGWIKNLIIDSKTGEVSPAMKKSLGATLRKQFNDTFLKDKLQMALEKAVQRDEEDKPILSFDTRPKSVKEAEAIKKAEKMQADLKKVSRDVVDVSISYFIRSKWKAAQARFDELVTAAFGKVGAKIKFALDAVFSFIFFKIVGTILSVLFWPAKQIIKQIIYSMISLDQNRDNILGVLTQVPADQPTSDSKHVVYNEDLVYKMGEALSRTFQEFVEDEPVLPMATETSAPAA